MADLIPELEDKWSEFVSTLADKAEAAAEKLPDPQRYTTATTLHDLPQYRWQLVRLDFVCMGLHLLCATYAFHSLPNVFKRSLLGILKAVRNMVGSTTAKKVIGRRPGLHLLTLMLTQIDGSIEAAFVESALEQAIRNASLKFREQLIDQVLHVNPKRRRTTKLVFTRHAPAHKQRKPNSGWRSPRR